MKTLEKTTEEKPKTKDQEQEQEFMLRGQRIQPARWYGTCYGRDLEAEFGMNYR
jgi:hypothetical protein